LLASGSVSYLWYADRVFEFPLGMLAVALGTAALPTLSAQAGRGALKEMKRSLSSIVSLTSFLAVPATVGLILLARPITSVIFLHGAFGGAEVAATAAALRAFAFGLWAASVARILVLGFYATGDSRTPTIAAAAAFAANLVCSLLLMGPPVGKRANLIVNAAASLARRLSIAGLGHTGLAFSSSLAAVLNLIVLVIFFRHRFGSLEGFSMSCLRSCLASGFMAPIVWWVTAGVDWITPGPLLARGATLALGICAGTLSFATAAWLLRSPELLAVKNLIYRN
jgi:putative peptidoglycan lipid II flippase